LQTDEALLERARIYRRVFDGADGEAVLADLGHFCLAHVTTSRFDDAGRYDYGASAGLEGRRQVWLKIQASMNPPALAGSEPATEAQTGAIE